MKASSRCWICGEDEPHTHSQDEVERARIRDTYADVIEPFVKTNYVMDEGSRWEATRIADALIAAGLCSNHLPDLPQAAQVPAYEIAMTLALSYGRDPDEPAPILEMCDENNQPVPIWMVYVEQAEAILRSYLVTRPHGGRE